MTDNLDELKKQWQSLSTRVDNLAETNRRLSERLAKSNVTSLQESLASRIRRWAGIELVMPLLAPMLYSTIGLPWPICVAYALFITSFFYALPDKDNTWVMDGFAAGLVIGLAIGIPRAVANHRIARKLVDSLKENS